jgi:hypothetical protein
VVAVLVPSRIALREHAERDPREREDVSGGLISASGPSPALSCCTFDDMLKLPPPERRRHDPSVSGVVVRWMDQVDERERRRVPHSDRAVAFRGGGVSLAWIPFSMLAQGDPARNKNGNHHATAPPRIENRVGRGAASRSTGAHFERFVSLYNTRPQAP